MAVSLNPGLFAIGGGAKQAKLPAPPKPAGVGKAGTAVLGAGTLSKPSVGTAGSALLGGANKLTQPQTPATATPAPAAGGGGSSGSPLDATYFQNIADNAFKVNNQINALNLTGSNDQTALQTALAALAYQQPRDQLALEQKANQGGGLYSSVENMNQANLVHSYATKQTADQTNYQNAIAKIASQIAGLQGGIPIYNQGQALASGQRAAVQAQNNPGLAAPPAPPAVPAAKPPAAKGKAPKPSVGAAGGALSNRQKLINQLSR